MPLLDARQTDLTALHPTLREAVRAVVAELTAANHPFQVFEAFRSPERQRHLYAKGRTAPGKKVTRAPAWSSYHQYGLAADFVLKIDDQWSWDTGGANVKHWEALHKIARKHGLEPLSWELPHLQLAGLRIEDLRRGEYPPFGDDSWADTLEAAISGWTGSERAPPPPKIAERPPLVDEQGMDAATEAAEAVPETGMPTGDVELNRPATPDAAPEATAMLNQFARIQTYIDKWEGGYVDHPDDPGGATNMGITLATFARWRGKDVSKAELKALTRDEQRQIMKAFYYDVVRGDELPAPIAALVYNAAVLHGPSRAARFLQTALREQGLSVSVDGAIGKATLGAVAGADVSRLVESYLSVQETFLRSLSHFKTFGKGWMNRLEDIGQFARSLLEPGVSPTVDVVETSELSRQPAPGNIAHKDLPGAPQQPLTPVNAALGTGIGNLLNGRKTAIGIIGTLAGTLMPEYAPALGILEPGTADTAADLVTPLSLAMAFWGVLGKAEKWMAQPPAPVPPAKQ